MVAVCRNEMPALRKEVLLQRLKRGPFVSACTMFTRSLPLSSGPVHGSLEGTWAELVRTRIQTQQFTTATYICLTLSAPIWFDH
jgi:uncharacterized protein YaaW (UPF0174 family)